MKENVNDARNRREPGIAVSDEEPDQLVPGDRPLRPIRAIVNEALVAMHKTKVMT